jgi:hypothetical protein
MSEAQRRAFGGDGFFFLSPPNDLDNPLVNSLLQTKTGLSPAGLIFLLCEN